MTYIQSDIRNCLSKMNDALFQEFGDELLYRIYYPHRVEARGSVIDKSKTRQGSPDTIFLVDDNYIFIEYTTQSSNPKNKFKSKLTSDLKSCLDKRKTCIDCTAINAIIIFTNQRIENDIKLALDRVIQQHNVNCILDIWDVDRIALELHNYPTILKNYLEIDLNCSAYSELQDFAVSKNNAKLRFSTPLDNKFIGRETDLQVGLRNLTKNDIVVISGPGGTGKTRFSLELIKQFCDFNKARAYVIKEFGSSLYSILQSLNKNDKYVLLIDDINRTAYWEEIVQYISNGTSSNIKFVATVRDYALDNIKNVARNLKTCYYMALEPTNKDIMDSVIDSLGITSTLWKGLIADLSKGNLRIAVMCSSIAINGGKLSELRNVEDIYDIYFADVYHEIHDNPKRQLLIKVLATISFFKVLYLKESDLITKIENYFGISFSDLKTVCSELEKTECINISEKNVITIADQSFANYIFYKCFFKEKIIDLHACISGFYRNRTRMIDSISSVVLCFQDTKQIIETTVKSVWNELLTKYDLGATELSEYLSLFANIIPDETLAYVKDMIDSFDVTDDVGTYYSNDTILHLLGNYYLSARVIQEFSLDLIVLYISKRPGLYNQAKELITSHWVSNPYDHYNKYTRQRSLIQYFINKSDEGGVWFRLCQDVLVEFLKLSYRHTSIKGHNYTMTEYPIILCDELVENRHFVLHWLIDNCHRIDNKKIVKGLYSDLYQVQHLAKELLVTEIEELCNYLNSIDFKDDYILCIEAECLIKRLQRCNPELTFTDICLENKLYLLEKRIDKGYRTYDNYVTKIEREINNLGKIVNQKSQSDIFDIADQLVELCHLKGIIEELKLSYLIEAVAMHDTDNALAIWKYCINKGYSCVASRIISRLIQLNVCVTDIYNFIKQFEHTQYSIIIDLVMVCLTLNLSNPVSNVEFINAIRNCDQITYKLSYIAENIIKDKDKKVVFRSILASLVYRMKNSKPLYHIEEFLIKYIIIYGDNLQLIERLYVYSKSKAKGTNHYFDSDDKLLKEILASDSAFWTRCCENACDFVDTCDVHPYNFIWNLDNCYEIIEKYVLHCSNDIWCNYYSMKNLKIFFYNKTDNKPSEYIDYMISKYSDNDKVMQIIFEIVIDLMGETRASHYVYFAQHNKDINAFKNLSFHKSMMTGGYSFAAEYESLIELISSIKTGIEKLHNLDYLPHIQFLGKLIEDNREYYNSELKKEHIRQLMDS